jgi:hypothetical protein
LFVSLVALVQHIILVSQLSTEHLSASGAHYGLF